MKNYKRFLVIAAFVSLIFAPKIAADQVVYDDFNDGALDPKWEISFEAALGWKYTEFGTTLTVTDITPEFVNHENGGPAAKVKLTRSCTPVGDFHVEFDFSWDSEDKLYPMQKLILALLDGNGDSIARVGYNDAWVVHRGAKFAEVNDNGWSSGKDTLPLEGSARLEIDRTGDEIDIFWDGILIHNGKCSQAVRKVEISFWYHAYERGGSVSYFGKEKVDLINVSGEPGTVKVCNYLGNSKWRHDRDVYVFEGDKGEKINVNLLKDENKLNSFGDYATIIVTNWLVGNRSCLVFENNRGKLPIQVEMILPCDSTYIFIIQEPPLLSSGDPFIGGYCLTMESSGYAAYTLGECFSEAHAIADKRFNEIDQTVLSKKESSRVRDQ